MTSSQGIRNEEGERADQSGTMDDRRTIATEADSGDKARNASQGEVSQGRETTEQD